MTIVAIAVHLILNKVNLLRMQEHLLKNAKSLEALSLKDSALNYFLALETAECGLQKALLQPPGKSFIEALSLIPNVGHDSDFERVQDVS